MRRALVTLLTFLALPGVAQACDERSWKGGTTEWCDGALVYRDYVYDDAGAEQNGASPHGAPLNPTVGDVDHRQHDQQLNSADLLSLRLRTDRGALAVRAELNTLFPTDRTVVAVAIDTDDDPATGGGDWGAVGVRSDGWDVVRVLDRRDPRANVVEGRVPLPAGLGSRIRVQAVVALGDGTPMNVAFRPGDHGDWWEADQAAALAAGDVSAFGQEVPVRTLLRGDVHRPAPPAGPGYYERVHRSKYALGEGIDYQPTRAEQEPGFQYLGPTQPYAIYVPKGRAPHGAQLLMHGMNAGFAAQINAPGAQRVIGDEQNRIIVSPLGRGPMNYWVEWGARDALDALADAERHYPIDKDAVVVSGYSMGGGGAMALATEFPDRFAAGISWVGYTGDCLNGTPLAQQGICPLGYRGNTLDYLSSTRHVPFAYVFGAADELAWPNHAVALMQRLEDLGYAHRARVYTAEHLTFALLDDWRDEVAYTSGRRRVRHPARVSYRTNRRRWAPELGLVPDGAYWVDALRPRDDAGDMTVELTSDACPSGGVRPVTLKREAGATPVPWAGQEGVAGAEPARPRRNRIAGTLTNVRSVRLDVAERA